MRSTPQPASSTDDSSKNSGTGATGLQAYQPKLRYLLVDERRLVECGSLPGDNLASLLFRLEYNRGLEDVQTLIQTVHKYTERPHEHAPPQRPKPLNPLNPNLHKQDRALGQTHGHC